MYVGVYCVNVYLVCYFMCVGLCMVRMFRAGSVGAVRVLVTCHLCEGLRDCVGVCTVPLFICANILAKYCLSVFVGSVFVFSLWFAKAVFRGMV